MDHKDALGMLLRMREVTDLESWCCCSLAGVAALVVSAKLEGLKTRQVVLLSRMGFCSRKRAAVGSIRSCDLWQCPETLSIVPGWLVLHKESG